MSAKKTARAVRKQQPHDELDSAREYRRILTALAQEGAYGIEMEDETGRDEKHQLTIVAPRKNVSVRIARTRLNIADALCRDEVAQWIHTSKTSKRRLVLTPTGQAKLRRLTSDDAQLGFKNQHQTLEKHRIMMDGDRKDVLINVSESPLAWLAARRGSKGAPLIDASALAAGERLRAEVERAQMLPRITANWSASISSSRRGSGELDFSESSLAAQQRVKNALRAVGPDFADLLLDVCVFLKGLEQIERERGWPARSAKLVLKMALARLAVHYGYSTEAKGLAYAHIIQHWGAENYRPSMGSDTAGV